MKKSILTKNQKRIFRKSGIEIDGIISDIIVTVRYDDEFGNGHNTFSITGNIYQAGCRSDEGFIYGGCIHDDICKYFPELAHLIPWHLCSNDGPMHYIENTLYHAKEISKDSGKRFVYLENKGLGIGKILLGIFKLSEVIEIESRYGSDISTKIVDNPMFKKADLDVARSSAIWPDASLEQLRDRNALEARLPELLERFRADIEALGFTW